MDTRNILLLLVGVIFLQGCATLNEHECMVSDWRSIGYEDGTRGASGDVIGKHRKACAKHGVAPDLQAYREGRLEGLAQFCQASNGFNLGARGGRYNGVCPAEYEYDFVDAYNSGRKLHDLQSNVNYADRQIQTKERQLEDLRKDLSSKEAALVSDSTTSEERVKLLSETRDLSKKQGELETEITELERSKAVHLDRLAQYRATLTYNY